MRRRKRRPGARRNLILLLIIIGIFGAISVGVHFVENEAPRLSLEDPLVLEAQRQAPENPVHLLRKVHAAYISHRNAFLETTLEDEKTEEKEASEADTPYAYLAQLLRLYKIAPDARFQAFFPSLAPIADELRPLRESDYFLFEQPVYRFADGGKHHWTESLGQLLIAVGYWKVVSLKEEQAGLGYFEDAMILSRLINTPFGDRFFMESVEESLTQALCKIIDEDASPEFLVQLADLLKRLGPPFPNREVLLEGHFRVLDNTIHQEIPKEYQSLSRGFGVRRYMARLRKQARLVDANKAACYESIALPYTVFKKNAEEALGDFASSLGWLLMRMANSRNLYYTLVLKTALQRYYLAYQAWPDALDELVPAYLEVLPEDSYTGKRLRYHLKKGGYILYSLGENGIDNGGKRHRDKILIEVPPPSPEKHRSLGRRH